MGFLIVLLCIGLVFVCLLLMGVILIQDSKGGGLAGAFGGAGGTELLGARGQQELAKVTTVLSVVFLVLCIGIGLLSKYEAGRSVATEEALPAPVEGDAGAGLSPGEPPAGIRIVPQPGATGVVPVTNGGTAPAGTSTGGTAPGSAPAGSVPPGSVPAGSPPAGQQPPVIPAPNPPAEPGNPVNETPTTPGEGG